MSLNGKIALVTGAATGIGASLAKALALEGALVVGADLAWGDSEQAPGVEQLYCDVSDPSDVERCVADIETRHGPVDILINNAALASALSPEPFEKITPELLAPPKDPNQNQSICGHSFWQSQGPSPTPTSGLIRKSAAPKRRALAI